MSSQAKFLTALCVSLAVILVGGIFLILNQNKNEDALLENKSANSSDSVYTAVNENTLMEEPKSTTNQDGHSELEQQQKEIEYADINKELEKLKEEKRLEIDRLARLKEEQSKIESQHKENEKSDNKLVNPVSDFKNFIERLNRELSDLPITNRAGKTWHIKYEITDLDLEKTNSLSKPYIATAVLKDVGFYNDDDVVRSAIRFTYSNDQWVFTESKMVNKFSKPPYSYKDLEFFPPQPDGQDPIILEAVQRANSE